MKFRIKQLPLLGDREFQRLQIARSLDLNVQNPGWQTPNGRKVYLVSGHEDASIGGLIGLSEGPDGFHIGSPQDNRILEETAKAEGWERIE